MVVKNLGNSFFEACRDGGLEAAEELGGIELIYQGPSTPTAEGQIEIRRLDFKRDSLQDIFLKAMENGNHDRP